MTRWRNRPFNQQAALGDIMAKRDSFLLRLSPEVLESVRRWADDELRSTNAQIEMLLTRALREAGRLPHKGRVEQQESNLSGETLDPDGPETNS